MTTDLYIFQWISDMWGADTRLKELLILLKDHFQITCIPNDGFRLQEKENTDYLDSLGVAYCMPEALPEKIEGFAYANQWNFPNMIWSERTGFLWDYREEAHEACLRLTDYETRRKMGKLASECARDIWCDADAARRKWTAVLSYALGSGT
jgi:hypothetical protein